MRSFLFLISTSFLTTLVAGLFWTGFPVMLSDIGHHPINLSNIYAFATCGSLIFGCLGGFVSDLGNCKTVSLISQGLSAAIIALIAYFASHGAVMVALYLLPVLYFNFSLGGTAELVWVLNAGESLKGRAIIDRAAASLLAKLIGFSMGPLFFNAFRAQAVLACSVCFFLIMLAQLGIRGVSKSTPMTAAVSFQSMRNLINSPLFLGAAFLTGLLSIPLNPLFISHILAIGTANDASWFWTLAGFAGLINVILQRSGLLTLSQRSIWSLTFLMAVTLVVTFLFDQKVAVIIFGSAFVFGSIQFSMGLYIYLSKAANKNTFGTSFGLLGFVVDAGVLVGTILGAHCASLPPIQVALCVIIALIVRAALTEKLITPTEI